MKRLTTMLCGLGFGLFISSLLLLAGCSKEEAASDRLPDGQYPMTFTASVEGPTATRATTDNSWTGGEEVAIQVGDEVKKYTAAAATGVLSAASDVTPFYWQTTADIEVSAWHSHNYSSARPTSFTVQADQSSTGYQQSDLLYAAAQQVTFENSALTFKHLPAKVVVNLKAGDGVMDNDVQSATVSIVNQALTSGAIDTHWTVAQATAGNSVITPNVLPTTTTDYQKSLQAIVVPQQMQSKKFIRVTAGGNDYFYTPATDANLEAGKQYTYNITVKKTELDVTIGTSVSWGEGNLDDGVAGQPTFRVTIPTVDGINPTLEGATKVPDQEYYEVDNNANTFSLTYTVPAGAIMNGFVAMQGVCDTERTLTSDGKYMFTYTNIRSDLKLAYDVHIEVGDFYCKLSDSENYLIPYDAPSLTDEQKSDCLGVVFWAGDITNDDPQLKQKFPDGTHGLVVALSDALSGTTKWSNESEDITNNWLALAGQGNAYGITSLTVVDKMQGYSNTKALTGYNSSKNVISNSALKVLPIDLIATYSGSHTPPASSSGWYFPSVMELKYVCWGQGNGQSTAGKGMLNTQFAKADGTDFGNSNYWSSAESGSYSRNAWRVNFYDGYVYGNGKGSYEFSVRPVLAF